MPQMSPLSWLTLLFNFIILLIFINILCYYLIMKLVKLENKKFNKLMTMNWKW
uniref:ATP synthase F0 subunit 8 n=1 Tax=Cerogria janthinipennis TaxID=1304780 RepID=UPI002201EB39|nr:ATP synthase F0 subunit 8 [Cerogria janthinipennis]UYB79033.1 ATP synthase F0 subunit 8 [Cerogria janthinipennis]